MFIHISFLSHTVPIKASGPPSSGPRARLQIVHLPLRPIEGALGRIVRHQGLVPRDLQRKGMYSTLLKGEDYIGCVNPLPIARGRQ